MVNIPYFFKSLYYRLKGREISRKSFFLVLGVISLVFSIVVGGYVHNMQFSVPVNSSIQKVAEKKEEQREENPTVIRRIPGPLSMQKMKTEGCVADGILSGYGGDTEAAINLINRSRCVYLHRAIETWLTAPDFDLANQLMDKIKKPDIIYGMFIAEAIDKKAKLFYPDEDRYFDFSDMCRKGSDNVWGEHSCKPSMEREEYRKYVGYITRRAMDLGVQSFLFGQVYYQDNPEWGKSEMPEVVALMRDYAKEIGIQVSIGAQTNDIVDERYLRLFDYIEGGVGLDSQGNIEDGPCLSWRGGCWALLWHPDYSRKANNVFLHFDWTGIKSDDMSTFARLDKSTRERTLRNLYAKFTSQKMGFMMPFSAVLHRQNGGCYGAKKRFYSPANEYNCQDEDVINSIMAGGAKQN